MPARRLLYVLDRQPLLFELRPESEAFWLWFQRSILLLLPQA